MAGSKRAKRTEEAAPAESPSPTASESPKTAEERAIDRESLEDYNGDIQDGLIDLVSKIKNDEPPPREGSKADEVDDGTEGDGTLELLEAVVSYLELQAQASMPQDKMRAELRAITTRLEKHASCPVGEKETLYRMDTSYYTNRTRILIDRQRRRKQKEGSQDEGKSPAKRDAH